MSSLQISCRLRDNFRVCSKCVGWCNNDFAHTYAHAHTHPHVRHSLHLQKWLFMYDSENDGSGNSYGIPLRYTLLLLLLHCYLQVARATSIRGHILLIGWIPFSYCFKTHSNTTFSALPYANVRYNMWICGIHIRNLSRCVYYARLYLLSALVVDLVAAIQVILCS